MLIRRLHPHTSYLCGPRLTGVRFPQPHIPGRRRCFEAKTNRRLKMITWLQNSINTQNHDFYEIFFRRLKQNRKLCYQAISNYINWFINLFFGYVFLSISILNKTHILNHDKKIWLETENVAVQITTTYILLFWCIKRILLDSIFYYKTHAKNSSRPPSIMNDYWSIPFVLTVISTHNHSWLKQIYYY